MDVVSNALFNRRDADWTVDDPVHVAVADLRGMLLFSAGFFAAHSVASSWIGPRAKRAKGGASSLYLFSYYLGSSIAGTLGGVFWHSYSWNGVGGFIALMLVLALLVGAICTIVCTYNPRCPGSGIAFINHAVTSEPPFAGL